MRCIIHTVNCTDLKWAARGILTYLNTCGPTPRSRCSQGRPPHPLPAVASALASPSSLGGAFSGIRMNGPAEALPGHRRLVGAPGRHTWSTGMCAGQLLDDDCGQARCGAGPSGVRQLPLGVVSGAELRGHCASVPLQWTLRPGWPGHWASSPVSAPVPHPCGGDRRSLLPMWLLLGLVPSHLLGETCSGRWACVRAPSRPRPGLAACAPRHRGPGVSAQRVSFLPGLARPCASVHMLL